MLCLQFYLGQIVAQKLNGLALRCLILSTNLCKLHVESHLLRQHADIVEKVRLHVTPHVWKPPKLMPVLQQHVVAFILLLCTCKNTYVLLKFNSKHIWAKKNFQKIRLFSSF